MFMFLFKNARFALVRFTGRTSDQRTTRVRQREVTILSELIIVIIALVNVKRWKRGKEEFYAFIRFEYPVERSSSSNPGAGIRMAVFEKKYSFIIRITF